MSRLISFSTVRTFARLLIRSFAHSLIRLLAPSHCLVMLARSFTKLVIYTLAHGKVRTSCVVQSHSSHRARWPSADWLGSSWARADWLVLPRRRSPQLQSQSICICCGQTNNALSPSRNLPNTCPDAHLPLATCHSPDLITS